MSDQKVQATFHPNASDPWFRRAGYHGDWAAVEPKWHLFEKSGYEGMAALCGYVVPRTYFILGIVRTRKTAPKVADRCRKCVKRQAAA